MKRGKILKTLFNFFFFLFSFLLILSTAYLLGHPILEDHLKGNDSLHALTYLTWVDRYFPKIPLWFPLQGGGISIVSGYPMSAFFLGAILRRLTNLDLIQILRLISFLTVPFISLGIFFFVWTKFKNKTIALLAGFFYLLSSSSWAYITHGGFFAQGLGVVLFIPTVFFFDSYLNSKNKSLVFLFLTSIFWALSIFGHYISGFLLLGVFLGYSLLISLLNKKTIYIKRFLVVLPVCLLLGSFLLVPFWRYSSFANREGLNTMALHQIPVIDLPVYLGLNKFDVSGLVSSNSIFPPIWILAILGVLTALARKKWRIFSLGIIGFGTVILAAMPKLAPFIVSHFLFLWSSFNIRFLIVAQLFLPILAAFGLVFSLRIILKKIPLARKGVGLLADFLAILVVFGGLFIFVPKKMFSSDYYWGGGPVGSDYFPFWIKRADETYNLPKFLISSEGALVGKAQHDVKALVERLNLPSGERIDISPNLGALVMSFNIYSETSQINTYTFQLSLIHSMWGYQQGVFYAPGFGTAGQLDSLATWFGTNYVFLNNETDDLDKYRQDSWETVFGEDEMTIKKSLQPTALAELSEKPAILVIGNRRLNSYEQVFKLATLGALSYGQAWLIEGKPRIDDYSLTELKKFDVIVLHGYSYHQQKRAWDLLSKYIEEGGSLFIDVGWQFRVPDWEIEKAPEFLPLKSWYWTDFGKTKDFVVEDKEIGGEVNPAQFASLIWDDQPWGVASVGRDQLQNWAKPILTVKGKPLVVGGSFGQGKVIWSGMNVIGHASDKGSAEEINFLNNLFSWLISEKTRENLTVLVKRNFPDRVEFFLPSTNKTTSLFWREVASPNWRAFLVEGNRRKKLTVYSAGPGFVLLRLPSVEEAKVVLIYQKTFSERIAVVISLLTFLILLLLLIDGIFLKVFFRRKMEKTISFRQNRLKTWWEKE